MRKIVTLIALSSMMLAGCTTSSALSQKEEPSYVTHYAQNHTETSVVVTRNGKTLVSYQAHKPRVLASTMKVLVALEYARQAAKGKLQPTERIPLADLARYYVKGTDGGAHENWLHVMKERKEIVNETVALESVAKGMIQFSSNANTEYMMHRLGMQAVNNVRKWMNMPHQEPLYPFSSAVLIPTYYKEKHPKLSERALYEHVKRLPPRQYRSLSEKLFKQIGKGKTFTHHVWNKQFDALWGDRLPKGTAAEYAALMRRLNAKKEFSKAMQTRLDAVMEGVMDHPRNQKWLRYAGQKGGSTTTVATNVVYATDKHGNHTEIVYFAEHVPERSYEKLTRNMNPWVVAILRDEAFRKKVQSIQTGKKSE
ncbi:serine hydrolase [Fictibacillus macauensis]|nr:serine hydrolase [Fictibacillus macauensis]